MRTSCCLCGLRPVSAQSNTPSANSASTTRVATARAVGPSNREGRAPVCGGAAGGGFSSPLPPPPPPHDYCTPGSACWPSDDDWRALNSSVGGRLFAVVPVGAPCVSSPGSRQCADVRSRQGDSGWLAAQAGAMQARSFCRRADRIAENAEVLPACAEAFLQCPIYTAEATLHPSLSRCAARHC